MLSTRSLDHAVWMVVKLVWPGDTGEVLATQGYNPIWSLNVWVEENKHLKIYTLYEVLGTSP